jgi:DNA processing protein
MAQGIDATAHRAAMEAGGRTVAVLGTGVDVPYPSGHRQLHAQIARTGCVLSEMEPGQRAIPGCFPRRNRLIAGLAPVTIVVEAPEKSGALLTATDANDAHRVVAAVPGPIDSPQSSGTNRLIRDGAQVIASVNDALTLMGLTPEQEETPTLRPTEQKIWELLKDLDAAPVELISARCGIELRETLAAITTLEIAGLITTDLSGAIRRR